MLMIGRLKTYYLLFLCCFSHVMLSQSVGEKVYFGYDDISSTEISSFQSGEFAVVASSDQSTVVLFFDFCGDTLWTREFFNGDNFNRLIRARNDNDYLYLAAALGSSADTALSLIKLDKTGQIIFSKSIQSPDKYYWYQFHIDSANDLYFTGNSINSNNNLASIILKLNDQGQEIHTFHYGSSFIWGMSTPAQNGGLLNSTGGTLFKVDPSGALQWTKTYSGFYQSLIPPISLNDGYLIFGTWVGASNRSLVFKVDLQGNFLWSSDAFLNANYTSAIVDGDKNLIISFTRFGNNGPEWGIQKISPAGANIGSWTLPYSSGDGIFSQDVKILGEQRMLLAGIIDLTFANYKALSLRYLPANLADLETCKATLTSLQTEASQISLETISPSLNPVPFDLFQINNEAFNTKAIPLNENSFCQSNHANFEFNLGDDTLICSNSELILKADTSASNFTYLWSTGENSSEINIAEAGLYWLEISNPCGSFTYRDSILVGQFPASEFETSFSPEQVFPGEEINFSGKGTGRFTWYFAEEVKQGESISFIASSTFADGVICKFIDTNGCVIHDTLYPEILEAEIYMPNAFTPNQDGRNDVFGLERGTVYSYNLDIFDRYGAHLASLVNESWDGAKYSGGAYIYVLQYQIGPATEIKTIKGIVNLIR